MARLYTGGFEFNHLGTDGAEGLFANGTYDVATAQKRTGTYSFHYNPASGANGYCLRTGLSIADCYVRVWFRASNSLSTGKQGIIWLNSTAGSIKVYVNAGSTVEVYLNGSLATTFVANVINGTWYSLLVRAKFSTSSAVHEVKFEGETWTDNTNDASTANVNDVYFGATSNETFSGTYEGWIDDIAINDATGVNENGYPSSTGKVGILIPTSDDTITNWTAGAGGTSNLFDAVDNLPPAGVASASETNTTNIESASNTGTATYIALTGTYTALGVGSSDTINLIEPIIRHGEDVATGAKGGTYETTSNPVISSSTFNFGDDLGAHGAEISNWRNKTLGPTYSPSVTLGSGVKLKVVKTNTTTRVTCVDLMAVIVDWTPANPLKALQGNIDIQSATSNTLRKSSGVAGNIDAASVASQDSKVGHGMQINSDIASVLSNTLKNANRIQSELDSLSSLSTSLPVGKALQGEIDKILQVSSNLSLGQSLASFVDMQSSMSTTLNNGIALQSNLDSGLAISVALTVYSPISGIVSLQSNIDINSVLMITAENGIGLQSYMDLQAVLSNTMRSGVTINPNIDLQTLASLDLRNGIRVQSDINAISYVDPNLTNRISLTVNMTGSSASWMNLSIANSLQSIIDALATTLSALRVGVGINTIIDILSNAQFSVSVCRNLNSGVDIQLVCTATIATRGIIHLGYQDFNFKFEYRDGFLYLINSSGKNIKFEHKNDALNLKNVVGTTGLFGKKDNTLVN